MTVTSRRLPGPLMPSGSVASQIVARATDVGFEDWWGQATRSGFCAAPIHLTGRTTDGQELNVMARCKNRRASVCPSCSALYAGDTWHLVNAGITDTSTSGGGGGVHPMVFATLTAPSFGPVHTLHRNNPRQRCHPSTGRGERCRHGHPLGCDAIHGATDESVGQPLCPECYDYAGHVLFTWHAPELWHRFTITLRRTVARRLRDLGEDPKSVRVSYVKVVELQRRAIPHFHAVIRLDATTPTGEPRQVPDTVLDAGMLGTLVTAVADACQLSVPGRDGEPAMVRFGAQCDAQPLNGQQLATDSGEGSSQRIAAYLAKYVTKSVTEFGVGVRRFTDRAIGDLDVTEHVRRILETVVALARHPSRHGLATWLHTLGYRGHITTKTRRYSTTMGALRQRRETWQRARNGGQHERLGPVIGDDGPYEADVCEWEFRGAGHVCEGDRILALTAATRAAECRHVARDELAALDQSFDP